MPELIGVLKNLVFSEDFCARQKENPKDFTRTRLLPFQELIFLLPNMNNSSYRTELDRYFKVIQHLEVAERIICKCNFSKAMAKLKYEAFVELNDHMLRHYYRNFPFETWCGFILLAIDGTMLRVPDENQIRDHFGVWNSNKGKNPCPKARASQLFDVLNKVTIDAIISPKSVGERELAA